MPAVPGQMDQTQGFTSLKTAAGDKVKSSSKSIKVKSKNLTGKSKKKSTSRERARVNVGPAIDKWRAMKAACGLPSDAKMAFYLLDAMKRQHPTSPSAEASDLKRKFSQSEVQTLIEQEVHRAVKRSETRLQDLIENIQKMNNETNLEHSIQKLQARVNLVSKRTEQALTYLTRTEKKNSPPSFDINIVGGHSDDVKMETSIKTDENGKDCAAKSEELFKVVETTKNMLKKIRKDNEVLIAAIDDLSSAHPPPVLTPYDSAPWTETAVALKNEPQHDQEQEPAHSNHHELTESGKEEEWLRYPRLPATTFPSVLSIEAASYSIPQKLEVKLALIRNPTRLSVLWNVSQEDPSAPPMESYTIFLTMEKVKGSGVFPDWHTYDKVAAKALPMCALIKKYKPGHKVCAAVLGKDIFGRYGPYSKVVTATIPN